MAPPSAVQRAVQLARTISAVMFGFFWGLLWDGCVWVCGLFGRCSCVCVHGHWGGWGICLGCVCVVVVACFLEFRESHRTNINGTHRHVGVYVTWPTPPIPQRASNHRYAHTHIDTYIKLYLHGFRTGALDVQDLAPSRVAHEHRHALALGGEGVVADGAAPLLPHLFCWCVFLRV